MLPCPRTMPLIPHQPQEAKIATAYDKLIATIIMSAIAFGALYFHWSLPGYITETNILQVLSVVTPILVGLIPNKATTAQKVQVLADAGVATTVTKS